jgi:hypothetical protein
MLDSTAQLSKIIILPLPCLIDGLIACVARWLLIYSDCDNMVHHGWP